MILEESIEKVFQQLIDMPEDELKAKLDQHKMGNFGNALIETGAIKTIIKRLKMQQSC